MEFVGNYTNSARKPTSYPSTWVKMKDIASGTTLPVCGFSKYVLIMQVCDYWSTSLVDDFVTIYKRHKCSGYKPILSAQFQCVINDPTERRLRELWVCWDETSPRGRSRQREVAACWVDRVRPAPWRYPLGRQRELRAVVAYL